MLGLSASLWSFQSWDIFLLLHSLKSWVIVPFLMEQEALKMIWPLFEPADLSSYGASFEFRNIGELPNHSWEDGITPKAEA